MKKTIIVFCFIVLTACSRKADTEVSSYEDNSIFLDSSSVSSVTEFEESSTENVNARTDYSLVELNKEQEKAYNNYLQIFLDKRKSLEKEMLNWSDEPVLEHEIAYYMAVGYEDISVPVVAHKSGFMQNAYGCKWEKLTYVLSGGQDLENEFFYSEISVKKLADIMLSNEDVEFYAAQNADIDWGSIYNSLQVVTPVDYMHFWARLGSLTVSDPWDDNPDKKEKNDSGQRIVHCSVYPE